MVMDLNDTANNSILMRMQDNSFNMGSRNNSMVEKIDDLAIKKDDNLNNDKQLSTTEATTD